MAEDFQISISAQLREHLRALRKRRGLTQAQLGELIGVSQARVAEIEANPGLVSLDQLQHILANLGAALRLHVRDETPPAPAPGVAEKSASPYAAPAGSSPAGKKRGSW